MALSITFFLIYIAIVIAIGILSSRKETEDGFMIADRKVEGLQVAATMSAGLFDGAVLAVYIAYIYQYGFSAIWMFVGMAIGFLMLRKYAGRIKQKADEMKVYSMPEYFYRIFGRKNGLAFSFLIVFVYFLLLIVNLIISAKIFSAIFPVPYFLSVIISGLVVLSYLLIAGFKAVVRTDFFQVIIMFVMSLSVGIFLFGKTDIPISEFNLGQMGLGNIIGFLILAGLVIMVAPDLWQRIFAAKDEKNLKRGLTYAAVILPVLGIIISVVGLATKQIFPGINPEDSLITGFFHLLPFGLKEFGIVLLYAVALSSSDTVTFVVSSIFTRDLKNYSQKFSEESMKKLTRFFMVIFIFAAALTGIFYQDIIALGFSSASLCLMFFPVVFGSLYWKLKESAVFWSLFLGFLSVLILFVFDILNPETAIVPLPVVLTALIILQKFLKNPVSAEFIKR